MRPLGRHQIQLLATLSAVDRTLVVPSKVSDSLLRRGLAASRQITRRRNEKPGFIGITPAGLRVVADLMEAGQLGKWTELPKPE